MSKPLLSRALNLSKSMFDREKFDREKFDRENLLANLSLLLVIGILIIALLFPLLAIFSKSLQNSAGEFVGFHNFVAYATTPALVRSITNSAAIGLATTFLVITSTFFYAYGLQRSCMPFKGLFRSIALIPILAPSLLPAISLVYWFGNQGVAKELLFDNSIYGPIGIVLGLAFWCFPHALMIINTAMSTADARLYEASNVLGASPIKRFMTATLPGVRYGLISATFVVFTLAVTDFGVPKVIGGQYNVLATDIYKQVIGQQNFQMGAVVSLIMLLPAIIAFAVDRWLKRRQQQMVSLQSVAYEPKPHRLRDTLCLLYCSLVAALLIAIIGMAAYASFVTFWPYNLAFTWSHYNFELVDGGGWASYYNSLKLSALTAVSGTLLVFVGAYLVEKTKVFTAFKSILSLLALIPMAVPGMVLGLAYIFFFNHPENPFGFIYGTIAILVLSTVAHYYTVSHLSSMTALQQLDPQIEAVSASLKVPFYVTFFKVTLPVSLPALVQISLYFFVNAMTTVSAVVFLYSPSTTLASVAILNMDDAGDTAPAAAMGMVIFTTSLMIHLFYWLFSRGILSRTQQWRRR